MNDRNRTPEGVPAGGQFTTATATESTAQIEIVDPFEKGQHGRIDGGGTWETFRTARGASFNPWLGKVRGLVDRHLDDIETDDQAREFASALGERLKMVPFYEHNADFECAVDNFLDAETREDLNESLSEMYNWADWNRYLLDFFPH